MIGFLSKIFGGNKSEKDVKKIGPQVEIINRFFAEYQSLSNDALRAKTQDFKQRIRQHLAVIDEQISTKKTDAENSVASEFSPRCQPPTSMASALSLQRSSSSSSSSSSQHG